MRWLKILSLVGLCTLVMLGTAGVVFTGLAEREWNTLQARVDAVQSDLDAQGWERSVLRGEASADEAFEHYERAIDLALAFDGPRPRTLTFTGVREAPPEEREALRTYLSALEPTLTELCLGAGAGRAKLELDWEGEEMQWESGAPDWPRIFALSARQLAETAYHAFLIQLAEGRPQEALEVLLDSLQFARDMAATPLLSESACGIKLLTPPWLDGFAREGGWLALPEEELNQWLDALAVVDEELETIGATLRVDAALTVRGMKAFMADAEDGPFVANLPLGPIVSVISAGLKAKTNDAHHLLLDFGSEYQEAFEADPLVAPGRVLEKYRKLGSPAQGYVEVPLDHFSEAALERVDGLAELRLLRHGLALQVGRTDAPPSDRLGRRIEAELAEGERRVFLEVGGGEALELSLPCEPPDATAPGD